MAAGLVSSGRAGPYWPSAPLHIRLAGRPVDSCLELGMIYLLYILYRLQPRRDRPGAVSARRILFFFVNLSLFY
jgi:hypothetical protein